MSFVSSLVSPRSIDPRRRGSRRRRPNLVIRRLASTVAVAALLSQSVLLITPAVSMAAGPSVDGITVANGISGGTYVGFNGGTPPNPQSLTVAGVSDWRIWGATSDNNLSGDDHKAAGAGISGLTDIEAGSPIDLRGLGITGGLHVGTGAGSVPFSFSWTDGTTAPSGASVMAGIQHAAPEAGSVGYGFSFTVPATPGSHTLRLWASAHHGVGKLTAAVGASTKSDTSVSGGQNHGGVYTINFTGDSTGQLMTVSYILDSAIDPPSSEDLECGGCTNNDANVVVYAAALDGAPPPAPDFTFGAPSTGASLAQPAEGAAGPEQRAEHGSGHPPVRGLERRYDCRRDPVRPRCHRNDRGIRDLHGDGKRQRGCRG